MIQQIKQKLDRILLGVLSFLLILIFLTIVWQVFSRYVLKFPATFTEEIVRFLLIWLGLLGASYGFGSGKHLALTLFYDKLTGTKKKYLSFLIHSIVIVMVVFIFIFGGVSLMLLAKTQVSSVLAIPMIYVYSVLPLSGVIIILYQLCLIFESKYQGGNR
ncbi:MAG: TRAP transporter small permease [Brevinema sp.]